MPKEHKLFELDESGKVKSVRGVDVRPEDHVIRVLSNQEVSAATKHSSWTLVSAYQFADHMREGLGDTLNEAEPEE